LKYDPRQAVAAERRKIKEYKIEEQQRKMHDEEVIKKRFQMQDSMMSKSMPPLDTFVSTAIHSIKAPATTKASSKPVHDFSDASNYQTNRSSISKFVSKIPRIT
jgi:hypothetical protein